jgi:hypothetical protein
MCQVVPTKEPNLHSKENRLTLISDTICFDPALHSTWPKGEITHMVEVKKTAYVHFVDRMDAHWVDTDLTDLDEIAL